MEVLNTWVMIVPVILFVAGIVVSFTLGGVGIDRVKEIRQNER
ncbi:hypothetical protein [Ferrovum sp. PN-J185]|nr:hypothetical protein [Ferrovum sp. PN-J185]KXW55541.1 hypothetical protein FV185_13090 [Ferrovum sp. PN-J185]